MIGLQERLEDAFHQFGWTRIPEVLHHHAEEASKHNISYLEFLDKLLQEELAAKWDRYIRTRTRLANLPFHKTLDQFDFRFQPSIDERRIRDLATLRFIEHQENLIFLGPPGVGKTHLAVALALEAIKQRIRCILQPPMISCKRFSRPIRTIRSNKKFACTPSRVC